VFRHINRHGSRSIFFVDEDLFALQTISAVLRKSVFDPLDHLVNVTFNGVVFVGKMFHCSVLSPVLEHDEESVFDKQFRGRFSAEFVELLVGNLQDCEHVEKGLPFDTEESFELSIACAQGFFNVFGLNQHGRQGKMGKVLLTKGNNFAKILQD